MNKDKTKTEYDNHYISFIEEQKDYIDKNYDISRSNNEIVNNDNIENFIFNQMRHIINYFQKMWIHRSEKIYS